VITVDEAIKRGQVQEWSPAVSHTEAETAYKDRALLAMEVLSMREILMETEEEVEHLRRELELDLPPFD
jgi:hypothetical protein